MFLSVSFHRVMTVRSSNFGGGCGHGRTAVEWLVSEIPHGTAAEPLDKRLEGIREGVADGAVHGVAWE